MNLLTICKPVISFWGVSLELFPLERHSNMVKDIYKNVKLQFRPF